MALHALRKNIFFQKLYCFLISLETIQYQICTYLSSVNGNLLIFSNTWAPILKYTMTTFNRVPLLITCLNGDPGSNVIDWEQWLLVINFQHWTRSIWASLVFPAALTTIILRKLIRNFYFGLEHCRPLLGKVVDNFGTMVLCEASCSESKLKLECFNNNNLFFD